MTKSVIIIHSNTIPLFSHICIRLFLLKRSSMWMDGWLCKSFVHPLILQEGDPQYCSLFRLKLPSPIFPVSKDQCLLEYKSPLMHLQPGLKGPNFKSKKKKKSAPKALAACQQFPTLGANQCIFTFQLMYRQLPIPVEVLRIFPCSSCWSVIKARRFRRLDIVDQDL